MRKNKEENESEDLEGLIVAVTLYLILSIAGLVGILCYMLYEICF